MTRCWILADAEKTGARNQCLGLATALNLVPIVIPIDVKAPWKWLPDWLLPKTLAILTRKTRDLIVKPWPELIIASGRKSVMPALALKKEHGVKVILLQKTRLSPKAFDLVVVPEHDHFAPPGTVTTIGNTNCVSSDVLKEARAKFSSLATLLQGKRTVVWLLGGPNRSFSFPASLVLPLLEKIPVLLEHEPNLVILMTASRRTPLNVREKLKRLTHPRLIVWNENSPNPYLAYLSWANAFVITSDSVAMVSEAASTGKGIYLIQLPGRSQKFERFYRSLRKRDIIRPYNNNMASWSYSPLNETQKIANIAKEQLCL